MSGQYDEVDLDKVELAVELYLRVVSGIDLSDPEIARVNFRRATISAAAHKEGRSAVEEAFDFDGSEEISFVLRLIGIGPKVVSRQRRRCVLPPDAITYHED